MTVELLERPPALPATLAWLGPTVARMPTALRLLTGTHAALYRWSGGRVLGRWFGTRILVMETVGRRTGRRRTTPLVYLPDGEDLVVLAANGGAAHEPSWWLNLRHTGHGVAILAGERRRVGAREANGAERDRLCRRLACVVPLHDYQHRTSRRLPVVVLTRTHRSTEIR